MAKKVKENIKDLKNIGSYGTKKLSILGIVGALILLTFAIIAMMFGLFHIHVINLLFEIIGLTLGILYAIVGIFGLIKVIDKQEGNYWGIFLVGSIIAILSPLAWFTYGGLVIAILAGITFTIYHLLEN